MIMMNCKVKMLTKKITVTDEPNTRTILCNNGKCGSCVHQGKQILSDNLCKLSQYSHILE